MAIFKAEDISVGIDGVEVAALSLSFQSSDNKTPQRRFGQEIDSTGFSVTGPQNSSINMQFYITGSGAAISNPVLDLLDGIDFKVYTTHADYTDFLGIYTPYHTGEVYLQSRGAHTLNYFHWSGGDFYGDRPNLNDVVRSDGGASSIYDVAWDPDYLSGIQHGFMGCLLVSTISLGGQDFASGAALTSLTIDIQPFSPIICSASFEIYNEVTGQFNSGASSLSIDPRNIAHGLYSTYTGAFTNVEEVRNIKLTYSANRIPRYELGKKHASQIHTSTATKVVDFAGYGRSATLEEPNIPFTITLGSQNQSNIFTDTVSGIIIDDSFAIPNVGIVSKQVKIIQNMV